MTETEDTRPFSSIRLNHKPLKECELALDLESTYRLYVSRYEHGFSAMAIEFVSSDTNNAPWECPQLEVRELLTATAFHDGIRHLEFNREAGDMAGYIYYPNMNHLTKIFEKLRQLETESCPNIDH